jgi:hypothetical protein
MFASSVRMTKAGEPPRHFRIKAFARSVRRYFRHRSVQVRIVARRAPVEAATALQEYSDDAARERKKRPMKSVEVAHPTRSNV